MFFRFFKFVAVFVFLWISVFVPSTVFALGPEVLWDNDFDIEDGTVTGYYNIINIEPGDEPLYVILSIDPDGDFDPATGYSNIANAVNGTDSFSAPSGNYFLITLVDADSFDSLPSNVPFSPYADGMSSNFDIFLPGMPTSQPIGSATNPGNPSNPPTDSNPGNQNPNQDSDNTASTAGWPTNVVDNPLAVSSINDFIIGLLNALLKIGIPIMIVFLVYSGMRIVMARGNEKELVDAKKNLLWVIIGIFILLGAWTIVKVLKATLDEITITFINQAINYFT